ncbi:MAG: flagellar biosynthesis protein FlhA [Candidatus Dactylopiibacterium carminicum]|uniref:Flagellar biosynthesis protein FlhA n=1 Tax=Candidatus Dactylopiibacterium carminicum TaxID=857335 RepID=A0A272EXT5_9RHOO|nr:flagellar biosynthesis protein FlhA [Candidatus Dactylopiibacterium carminicum]KAF7599979.1 flagellar biosynthesis protein FlhA [Candidatus Dactylopiibacterium carminicum]PAS94440.1 MAG: flagellar biosynthesis protein FlhA [Candidatus Dactylopiibacterium carminicum]PAS99981.1 MAG: flagellar biosynthesis protein FlhA [Candidatus Dactylopiibacterium carminicum]
MNALRRLITDLARHRVAAPLFVILVSVNAKRPLDFSVFPTVILATTLMRLTLNVASTRVVLLHGHEGTASAGQVIEAFGHVVIGGNFVVGLVVFVILMIINFIVVTKGAERISEVSARFTLDALPGKQMAIDADLNAGLINQEKTQLRRREVAAEADFYGAMDGASKFVRGDAIAGILILLINMIGGVAIGALMHDLTLGEAFRLYALLTIGDGLVAQIPALLLSAAAAIIVTRVGSESKDFEQQVGAQLLASPSVLYGAAGLMLILGAIPGMPWMVFLGFAGVLAFVAWRIGRHPARPEEADTGAIQKALLTEPLPEFDWRSLPFVEVMSVTVGYKLVRLIDHEHGAPLVQRIKGIRQSVSENMGLLLPPIGVRDDLGLKPAQYAIKLSGSSIAQGEVYADHLMTIPSPQVFGDLDGIPGVEPAYGMPVTWIAPENKAHALGLGYQVVDIPNIIATHVAKMVRDHLPELVRHEDVPALMERLAAVAPKLSAALDKALTHTQMLKVFRVLLAENVSLKDIVPIATALLENAELTKDPILLAAEVRCILRRQIVAAVNGNGKELRAFNLGGELENMLLGSLNQARQGGKVTLDNYPIDPNLLSQLQMNMPVVREQMKQQGGTPLLLVMPQIRPLLARYARLFAPGLTVLSYNEIPEQLEISIIGSLG